VTAAVSDRSDVLVVWHEERAGEQRVRAARRLAGGAFGPVETVGARSRRTQRVTAGIANTGEAFVLMARARGTSAKARRPARVAMAAPGAAFDAPVTVGDVSGDSTVALAVAPDGRGLVVVPGERSLLVAERPPGGAFGAPVAIADVRGQRFLSVQAAVGSGGEAAVAWQRTSPGEALIVTRAAPGAFGPPRSSGRTPLPDDIDPLIAILLGRVLGPLAELVAAPEPPLTVTPDGRALFSWWDETRAPTAPAVVAAPLAGGPLARSTGGRSVAGAGDVFPLVLANGAPALVWTSGGRLHLATEGAVTPEGPALPTVTAGVPRSRVLGPESTLRLPLRCSRPCEVVATVGNSFFGASGELSLPRGGAGVLAVKRAGEALAAPRSRVPVTLVYGAPDGFDARAKTFHLTLERPRNAPDTRVRAVRAVRRGNAIRVSWSTAGRTGEDAEFLVTGTKARDRGEDPIVLREYDVKPGRQTFSITLKAGREVRWVAVRSEESLQTGRPSFARVR
jgi:hypothetical protein